jgi:hypothetical protein
MSGKFSKIKWTSNKTFNKYNSDGSIKTNRFTKKELEEYLKRKKRQELLEQEKHRKPRIKRNGNLM